jgi:hypothetical protein
MAGGKARNDVHPNHRSEQEEHQENNHTQADCEENYPSHTSDIVSVLFTVSVSIANHLTDT